MFAGWKSALPGGQRTRRNVSPPRVPVKTDGRTDGRTWGAGDAHDLDEDTRAFREGRGVVFGGR